MRISLGELRSIILEAAQTASGTSGKGLALYRFKGKSVMQAVIYDPNAIIDMISDRVLSIKSGKLASFNDSQAFFAAIERRVQPTKFIKGMLSLTPPSRGDCYGGWIVKTSAAEKGFGPLVYDIAMSMSPNFTLIPDRASTSTSAGMIWKYYKEKRTDIQALPLDDIDNPKTKSKHDDCKLIHDKKRPWLDFAYQGNSDDKTNNLDRNHKNMLWVTQKILTDNGVNLKDVPKAVEMMIGNIADASFFNRFLGVD